jgi:protein-S-isoprenylcysteine O-methyltransferase Ste14
MADKADTAQVRIRPPIALALAIAIALGLDILWPLPFLTAGFPRAYVGGVVIATALALFIWAVVTMTRAGTNIPTNLPTLKIVESGPYGLTRNPIYLAMTWFIFGLALGLDTAWLILAMIVLAVLIHYQVVVHEEAYLESKFGDEYRAYRSRVRRWL